METNPFIYESESIKEVSIALSSFQNSIVGKLFKEDKGQFKYAKLETILNRILGPLHEHQLSLTQSSFVYNSGIYLKTRIVHSSGEYMASIDYLYSVEMASHLCSSMQEAGNTQKILGCIKTYQCRYALKNFLGLPLADEDFDDIKTDAPQKETKSGWKFTQQPGCINEEESNIVMKKLYTIPEPIRSTIRKKYTPRTTEYIKKEDLDNILEDIEAARQL